VSEIRGPADNGGDLSSDDVSRAYRLAAVEEPSPELDETIHAAALRAAGSRPRRTSRGPLRRWRVPIAVAATIVVGVSVAFLAMDPASPPVAPMVESPVPHAGVTSTPGHSVGERPLPAPGAANGQEPVAAAARDARPSRERTTRDQIVPRREQVASPSAAPESEPRFDATLDQFGATPSAVPQTRRPWAVPDPAQSLGKTVPGVDPRAPEEAELLSPELWLEHIRELRNKGELARAEESLRAFRLRYPDYPLPADFPVSSQIGR
jgi:hypothetical protein